MTLSNIRSAIATGAIAVGSTLLVWVALVYTCLCVASAHPVSTIDGPIWAGTLWLSALTCSGMCGYHRNTKRPVLGSVLAFAVFALVYMACEGSIFGNVSQGGDPDMTTLVVWNLVLLPLGVFLAAEIGATMAMRRNRAAANSDEP